MMQKLMEINDHLVRTLAECEQLRSDQKTLQEICSMGRQRITELQDELRKACAERDEAVEHAARLQAQLAEVKSQLEAVVQERYNLQTELAATHEALQRVCSTLSPKSAGQNDLVRDVSHYIEAAEVDRPTEPEFKPYTFAAYIVGDKSQPDALRIVWATEEWIQHSQFGIVHRMRDMQFSGNDTFTPDQFSVNLKIQ